MSKTRKIRNRILFAVALIVGLVGAVGIAFIPQVQKLIVNSNVAVSMLIVVALFISAFALAFGVIILVLRTMAKKGDGKKFEKVVIAKSAVAQGLIPAQDLKTISKEQKLMNKTMNKKAFARRKYEQAMKHDDKF